ncbi:hypothetical protein [Mycobacterium sp. GA-2829]|uniref:hypothetical protein n=1 Tax=Mycobacterium sp. GA-2829 TaxID=1772283 RepID=UPI000740464D|nr:hypothetical protein [Mycobacterium sp. GA-2829]KUI29301.1 hypothetical protein AU194_20735 [Mycobacterium sp. GA-2829]
MNRVHLLDAVQPSRRQPTRLTHQPDGGDAVGYPVDISARVAEALPRCASSASEFEIAAGGPLKAISERPT